MAAHVPPLKCSADAKTTSSAMAESKRYNQTLLMASLGLGKIILLNVSLRRQWIPDGFLNLPHFFPTYKLRAVKMKPGIKV